MEICCYFKSVVGGKCSFHRKDRARYDTQVIPLLSCKKDITRHTSTYKFGGFENEVELILCRAGMFTTTPNLERMTICPSHRSSLGIGWSRGSTIKCRVPQAISGHGKVKTTKWPKAERGIGKQQSAFILRETGVFIQVGSGMCKVKWIIHCHICVLLNLLICYYILGVCTNCKKKMAEK